MEITAAEVIPFESNQTITEPFEFGEHHVAGVCWLLVHIFIYLFYLDTWSNPNIKQCKVKKILPADLVGIMLAKKWSSTKKILIHEVMQKKKKMATEFWGSKRRFSVGFDNVSNLLFCFH